MLLQRQVQFLEQYLITHQFGASSVEVCNVLAVQREVDDALFDASGADDLYARTLERIWNVSVIVNRIDTIV